MYNKKGRDLLWRIKNKKSNGININNNNIDDKFTKFIKWNSSGI